jgi:membrane protease YdiL (CAAX protease family)
MAPPNRVPVGTGDHIGRSHHVRCIYHMVATDARDRSMETKEEVNCLLVLFRNPHMERSANIASRYIYSANLLFFLLVMLVVVFIYRPIGAMVKWTPSAEVSGSRHFQNLGYGVAGGLVCCAVAVPIMVLRGGMRVRFFFNIFSDAYGMSAGSILMFLMVALALPIASELVFRGVILRTLAEYVSIPAAIIASSVLFAYWWPVLDWYEAIIIGLVSAILYCRTRTLTASVIANAILSVGSGVLIVFLAYR